MKNKIINKVINKSTIKSIVKNITKTINKIKSNKIIICFFAISIIILFFYFYNFKINKINIFEYVFDNTLKLFCNNKNEINSKKNNINNLYFFENILKNEYEIMNIKEKLPDRFILFDKEEKIIQIGKNKKELENGYYDVNLIVKNNSVIIAINKLFKEFSDNNIDIIEDQKNININQKIDEEYFEKIMDIFIYVLNLNLDIKEKKYLKDVIKTNYLELRNVKNIDNLNGFSIDKKIENLNYKMDLKVEDNILNVYLFFK